MQPNYSNSQQAYAIAVGTTPTNAPILSDRAPNSNDTNYKIGQFWVNTITSELFYLNSLSAAVTVSNPYGQMQATWIPFINSLDSLQTLSDSLGTIVLPTLDSANPAGNIQLNGTGSITTVASSNTITTELTGLTNHSVLVGAGTPTITNLAVGTNGQVLIGATGADPAFASLTSTGGTIIFTAGANSLNLEAGTTALWTPNLQINASSFGITYSNRIGGYTKIGNLVTVWINISLSSKGISSGPVTISNLPFAAGANGSNIGVPINIFNGWTLTGYTSMGLTLISNSAICSLVVSGSGVPFGAVNDSQITNSFFIATSFSYLID